MSFPKIIVIAGDHSNIGKTTLAYKLCELLANAVRIKIGHHPRKEHGAEHYYYAGATFAEILSDHRGCSYLIIESNQILSQVKPDCLIFLTGQGPVKPSAATAINAADIIRGKYVDEVRQECIARALNIDRTTVKKMIEFSGEQLQ